MRNVELRAASPDDDEFLLQLYIANQAEAMQLTGWSDQQIEAFLKSQFLIRKEQYANYYPDAKDWIILQDGQRVGRFLIDQHSSAWAIIDIGLLPAHQNQGIGTFVLSEHLQQAVQAAAPVRLHVLCENHAAQRLYERHGFVITGQSGLHFEMLYDCSRAL